MRELSYETSLLDKSGHLRRVEVLPARTRDAELPLIDETREGIREINDKTPNEMPPGQPLPEYLGHSWVHTLAPDAEDSASIRSVEGGWPGTDLVIIFASIATRMSTSSGTGWARTPRRTFTRSPTSTD
jgi:hypothetical protein